MSTRALICAIVLFASAAAQAQDAGQRIFTNTCARCHKAEVGGRGLSQKGSAPDLAQVTRDKKQAYVLTWIESGWKQRSSGICNPTWLKPGEASTLANWLVTVSRAAPMSPDVSMRESLKLARPKTPKHSTQTGAPEAVGPRRPSTP